MNSKRPPFGAASDCSTLIVLYAFVRRTTIEIGFDRTAIAVCDFIGNRKTSS